MSWLSRSRLRHRCAFPPANARISYLDCDSTSFVIYIGNDRVNRVGEVAQFKTEGASTVDSALQMPMRGGFAFDRLTLSTGRAGSKFKPVYIAST